jgi:hypothetical protein
MALTASEEIKFLLDNPEFEERPASIVEFVDKDYLDIKDIVRPAIMECLTDLFGPVTNPKRIAVYERGQFTGAIGIGKTTLASIILPYMAHWVLCLKDPQRYFGLLPGSRIAFMQMSTSEPQAREVVFGDIKARITHSDWFMEKYPYNTKFTNQIRFEKDVWIIPGDSAETTFEGYNILGGILDEADSHKVTKVKDYAEEGYNTISSRISSRFQERGFMLVVGQMKKAAGFAARKYAELEQDPTAYTKRMTIWESFGWDNYLDEAGERDSFFYDKKRKEIIPAGVGRMSSNSELVEIPRVYMRDFVNNPEKALRDLAGIPPAVGDPFISLTYKIDEARDRWMGRHGIESPYIDGKGFIKEFRAKDSLKRACHIDMAFSGSGDALGFAMGHVAEMVTTEDGENKPYIIIDCLVRLKAAAGQEIFIGDIRRLVYDLRDERKFKITKVTLDGFQSTDTRQQFLRRRIDCEHVSVDKTLVPYYDLRDALYEGRIEFPRYMVGLRVGDTDKVEIMYKELSELEDNGNKIDHPAAPMSSKDVSDAVAGVVYTLMGDRTYHRKLLRMGSSQNAGINPDRNARPGNGLIDRLPTTAPVPERSMRTAVTAWNPPQRKARR